jgi:hypothetical protein
MSIADKILTLTRQLYPSGRAFKMPPGGFLERTHKALAVSEAAAYSDIAELLYAVLPDNSNFTADDATDWERRLGLVSNPLTSLADRKLAIKRKMNHPGTIPARQHYLYLQGQLQAAGFSVYVYENRFPIYPLGDYETRNPLSLNGGLNAVPFQLGDHQLGDRQLGQEYDPTLRIINSVDEDVDALFDVGSNLKSTFFIGGSPLGTYASVDATRKEEFRQLVLRIKPVQTVAYLFINFV